MAVKTKPDACDTFSEDSGNVGLGPLCYVQHLLFKEPHLKTFLSTYLCAAARLIRLIQRMC